MNCTDCADMVISAQISKSATIQCIAQDSCDTAQVTLTSTSSVVNYSIICDNPSLTSSGASGACYTSDFYIYGYIDPTTNEQNNTLSIVCNQRDCYDAGFNGYNLGDAMINCKASC